MFSPYSLFKTPWKPSSCHSTSLPYFLTHFSVFESSIKISSSPDVEMWLQKCAISFILLQPSNLLLAGSASSPSRPASIFAWTAPQAHTHIHILIQGPATTGNRTYESTSEELLQNAYFWNEACTLGRKQARQENKKLLFWHFQVDGTTVC